MKPKVCRRDYRRIYFSVGVLVEHIVEHRQPPELRMVESAVKLSITNCSSLTCTIYFVKQNSQTHIAFSRCQVQVHRNNLYTKTTPLFTGEIRYLRNPTMAVVTVGIFHNRIIDIVE